MGFKNADWLMSVMINKINLARISQGLQLSEKQIGLLSKFFQNKNQLQEGFTMDIKFLENVVEKHRKIEHVVSNGEVENWALKTMIILFPSSPGDHLNSLDSVQRSLREQKTWLVKILKVMEKSLSQKPETIADEFFETIPTIYQLLQADVHSMFTSDPAARSPLQIIRAYPGFYALAFHRIAHQLYKQKVPMVPRMIASAAHSKTGIDIHPGAQIGRNFCIDHGTGVVIGQTAIIGNDVKIYQGVTLGALAVKKNLQDKKRQPTIEDGVVIYAGATILGGQTVVGHHSIIGGSAWLTESVPPYTKVFHKPQIEISTKIAPEIAPSIQQIIGNTPLVEIKNIFRHPHVRIFAKLEGQNPGGSVKDRAAFNMIQQALKRGQIKPGMKLIQPTSGNTGVALAMIASMFNLDLELVMPQNSTQQRVQTMEAYGAKVILTSAEGGIEGSRDYAQKKVNQGGYKMLDQFSNPDNFLAHYNTTGPQIYRDTQGNVTHFVSAMGTTGTIMGTSMFLKQKNPQVKIIGVQPVDGARIPGIRRWSSQYLPRIYNREKVDDIIDVSEQESIEMVKRLAREEAIFAGMSSGGAMTAALKVANRIEKGVIVTIICDRGDRYISSGLFTEKRPKL